jgi:hypothetical protein
MTKSAARRTIAGGWNARVFSYTALIVVHDLPGLVAQNGTGQFKPFRKQ